MSEYVDPAADAAVRAQLGEQAASFEQAPAVPDLSAAKATAVDVDALVKQLQALQAKAQAAVDAANPPQAPPDDSILADSNAPGWMHAAFAKIEKRLGKLEGKDEPAEAEAG
jgi:hypothetical protein